MSSIRLTVPRAPTPPVRTEAVEDYERKDVALIRAAYPVLQDHTDDEIACLWTWFSVEWMCASWMGFPSSAFDSFLEHPRTPEEWLVAWEYG